MPSGAPRPFASPRYLAAFQLLYYVLEPGIGEKYAECMVERVRRSGGNPDEIAAREEQARRVVALYENPWGNIALTLVETLPVGLVLTTLSGRHPPAALRPRRHRVLSTPVAGRGRRPTGEPAEKSPTASRLPGGGDARCGRGR